MSGLTSFKKDEGYAASIETPKAQMLSSHAVKHFFRNVSIVRVWLFRKVLRRLFVWRLTVEQPLQLYRGRYMIDAIFRNGKAYSNYGDHVIRMISTIVKLIRRSYRLNVTIVLVADSGFFDQKILKYCEKLQIGIIVGGKMYNDIKEFIIACHEGKPAYISPQAIITTYHQRGRDELVNRGLKDFGGEQLPFTRFVSNAAFYYLMIISFFLFEVFRETVGADIIPLTWYATTFRRRCVAGKIVRTGRQVVMQVTRATWDYLRLDILWRRCVSADSSAHVT